MSKDISLFISPHLDDAALSCGGLMRKLADMNNAVLALTIFTADLPPGISPSWLARRNHMAWNAGSHPFAARRLEDKNAMQALGADFLHLHFLDAMYRMDENGNPYYLQNTVGIKPVAQDEKTTIPALIERLHDVCKTYENDTLHVFCPLGLGGHIDHALTRRAVETVWAQEEIIYYEDFPYAGRPGSMQAWQAKDNAGSNWIQIKINLSDEEIKARVISVGCYVSQLRGLFPSRMEQIEEIARARLSLSHHFRLSHNVEASFKRMDASLRGYIANLGGERYWMKDQPENRAALFLQVINTP